MRDGVEIMSQLSVRRHRSFLDSSLKLDGITAILESLLVGQLSYTRLYVSSNIKFKKSFLKYLDYCKEKEFVTKHPGRNTESGRGENQRVVYYKITDKGRNFLELLA